MRNLNKLAAASAFSVVALGLGGCATSHASSSETTTTINGENGPVRLEPEFVKLTNESSLEHDLPLLITSTAQAVIAGETNSNSTDAPLPKEGSYTYSWNASIGAASSEAVANLTIADGKATNLRVAVGRTLLSPANVSETLTAEPSGDWKITEQSVAFNKLGNAKNNSYDIAAFGPDVHQTFDYDSVTRTKRLYAYAQLWNMFEMLAINLDEPERQV